MYWRIDELLCYKRLITHTMTEKTTMKDISHTAPHGENDTQRVYNRGGEVIPEEEEEE